MIGLVAISNTMFVTVMANCDALASLLMVVASVRGNGLEECIMGGSRFGSWLALRTHRQSCCGLSVPFQGKHRFRSIFMRCRCSIRCPTGLHITMRNILSCRLNHLCFTQDHNGVEIVMNQYKYSLLVLLFPTKD